MNLTEQWAYEYVLKPDATHAATISPAHQKLAANHKFVLAMASLSSFSHHSNNPPSASAFVGYTQYVQGGQVHDVPEGLPVVIGANITDVRWTFRADKCWARASVVILCFD